MLRSIGAVLGGYATLALLTLIAFAVLTPLCGLSPDPTQVPPDWFSALVLVIGVVYALAGGWVCARLARSAQWQHVAWLAGIVLVLGVGMALSPQEAVLPGWYRFGLPLIGAAGVLAGGRLRLRPA